MGSGSFDKGLPGDANRKFRWSDVDTEARKPLEDLLSVFRQDLLENPLSLRHLRRTGNDPAIRGLAAGMRGLTKGKGEYPEDQWDRQQFEIRVRELADDWVQSAFDIYSKAIESLGFDPSAHSSGIWAYGLSGFITYRVRPLLEIACGVTDEDRGWLRNAPGSSSKGATAARLKLGAVQRTVEFIEAHWGAKLCPGYTNRLIEASQAMARYNAAQQAATQSIARPKSTAPTAQPLISQTSEPTPNLAMPTTLSENDTRGNPKPAVKPVSVPEDAGQLDVRRTENESTPVHTSRLEVIAKETAHQFVNKNLTEAEGARDGATMKTFAKAPASAISPTSDRNAVIDAFLAKCNADLGAEPRIIKKHIWQAAGHTHPRQFQYWQAGEDRAPENNRGATEQDERNFRRILNMSPEDFRVLLRKMKLV